MRERQFIEQNKQKWREFELLIQSKDKDPEKLGELFVQITDDLSYARTFYPNRSVRVYLNKLAQQVFHKLYQTKKKKKNRFVAFVVDDIPSAVYHARRELFLSFVIFTISMAIGVFSAIKDPDFAKSILSEQYVEMTEQNIENDDPMAVYKDDNQFYVFAYIAKNNLAIDVRTFASGLFFGLWTVLMLVYNGIMVGAFQYFFVERGLFVDSFLTIWMHGALELSAAVIAGGAGLILGRGIVFPGTYSRLQSLIIAAKQGLKIFLIAIVMTTFAAFIESFVTRYTGIHNVIRLIWILLSFAFVIGYFIVLPYLKKKRGTLNPPPAERLQQNLNHKVELSVTKSIGKLFSDAFATYRETISSYLPYVFGISFLYTLGMIFLNYQAIYDDFFFAVNVSLDYFSSISWTYMNMGVIYSLEVFDFRAVLNCLVLTFTIAISTILCLKYIQNNKTDVTEIGQYKSLKIILLSFLLAVVVQLFAYLPGTFYWLFILSPIPLMLSIFIASIARAKHDKIGTIIKAVFWPGYGLYLAFILICTILFTLITYPIFQIFFQFAQMFIDLEAIDYYKIYVGVYIFFSSMALMLVIPPIIYGFCYLFFAGKEKTTAKGLRNRLRFLDEEPKTIIDR